MRKIKAVCILSAILLAVLAYLANAYDLPKTFSFDKKDALNEWQEKVFKNKVIYTVRPRQEEGFLSAKSEEACSGLFYRIRFDPAELPMISWDWKIIKFPKKGSVSPEDDTKKGWIEKDDYAARVYVIFPSLNFRKTKSLEYVWDESLQEETIMTSPYFKNIKIIVAQSGKKNMGQWMTEKRNIYEDYKKAFGDSPPNVGAVALMTDTDNTLSTAEALYRNIKVGYKDE